MSKLTYGAQIWRPQYLNRIFQVETLQHKFLIHNDLILRNRYINSNEFLKFSDYSTNIV